MESDWRAALQAACDHEAWTYKHQTRVPSPSLLIAFSPSLLLSLVNLPFALAKGAQVTSKSAHLKPEEFVPPWLRKRQRGLRSGSWPAVLELGVNGAGIAGTYRNSAFGGNSGGVRTLILGDIAMVWKGASRVC